MLNFTKIHEQEEEMLLNSTMNFTNPTPIDLTGGFEKHASLSILIM